MTGNGQQRRRRPRLGVDLVAAILATGLALTVLLILIATVIQILTPTKPLTAEVQLSENATQILIAAIGGIVGVLGGYIGYRLHHRNGNDDPPNRAP